MILITPAGGGDIKKQGSNTIMSTSLALKCLSNKIIDVDIILIFYIDSRLEVAHFSLWRKKVALK